MLKNYKLFLNNIETTFSFCFRKLGLYDSTVIAFISDHGYHMGEHGHIGKRMSDRTVTHIPFMMHVPGVKGQVINDIVESIDLYPTLVEAAGFKPLPKCKITPKGFRNQAKLCTEGRNLLELTTEEGRSNWRNEAFVQEMGKLLKGKEKTIGDKFSFSILSINVACLKSKLSLMKKETL